MDRHLLIYKSQNDLKLEKNLILKITVKGKEISLNRSADDSIENTLKRLALTAKKKLPKEYLSKLELAPILVDDIGQLINIENMTNGCGWQKLTENKTVYLKLSFNEKAPNWKVVYNPPVIRSLKLAVVGHPQVGSPIVAVHDTEFSHYLEHQWETVEKNKSAQTITKIVSEDAIYMPTESEIGKMLKLTITPIGRDELRGVSMSYIHKHVISDGETPEILKFRENYVPLNLPCFRVASYNILADRYCDSDFSAKYLYPFCPRKWLNLSYRIQIVIKELLAYKCDVICLQECDKKSFDNVLKHVFKAYGFNGLFKSKCGASAEGSASFFNESKFLIESEKDFNFKDEIGNMEVFKQVYKRFPHLFQILTQNLTTICQITILKQKETSIQIIIANTHLFFHPDAAHIRTIQMVCLTDQIKKIKEKIVGEGFECGVIICGDMNSVPQSSVQYLKGVDLNWQHLCWTHTGRFEWGEKYFKKETEGERIVDEDTAEMIAHSSKSSKNEEELTLEEKSVLEEVIPNLKLDIELFEASGDPPFTNFTPTFTEKLDYIFAESNKFETISK